MPELPAWYRAVAIHYQKPALWEVEIGGVVFTPAQRLLLTTYRNLLPEWELDEGPCPDGRCVDLARGFLPHFRHPCIAHSTRKEPTDD